MNDELRQLMTVMGKNLQNQTVLIEQQSKMLQ
jgi:hypothetical protein